MTTYLVRLSEQQMNIIASALKKSDSKAKDSMGESIPVVLRECFENAVFNGCSGDEVNDFSDPF